MTFSSPCEGLNRGVLQYLWLLMGDPIVALLGWLHRHRKEKNTLVV
jgi:hypothetical protein